MSKNQNISIQFFFVSILLSNLLGTKVEIFINLSAFIYPYTAECSSGVDAMLEYGYEIVFACRKFMFITIIFLLHGCLLPNNSVAMY